MLIEFRVENHRSLRDEQALTMRASADCDDINDLRQRRIEGCPDSLLPVAALYGANGSGKSNLLSALGFMREAVLDSHRSWPPEQGVPRQPFAWGGKRNEPSFFEVAILIKGIRYEYGFVADNNRILEEWLYAWINNNKEIWFVRDDNGYEFGRGLVGKNEIVRQATKPNALFVSTSIKYRHKQIIPLYRWFRDLEINNVGKGGRISPRLLDSYQLAKDFEKWLRPKSRRSLFERELISEFLELIRAADVGIVDLKVESGGNGICDGQKRFVRPCTTVWLKHEYGNHEAWLPLDKESHGTLMLFQIGPILLDILRRGGVLVIDELEKSLHFLLALELVHQFNNPVSNPRNAQLVFTTHDTQLLGTVTGNPPLRRDQIWFTEKNQEGATYLYPLTDYKPLEGENLERGYLQGRYGAIPFLGDFSKVAEGLVR